MDVARVTIVRQESTLGCWEVSSRPPSSRLRPYVARMDGHVEAKSRIGPMREVPWAGVVIVLSLGPAYTARWPGNVSRENSFSSFAAGLTDRHVFVEPAGLQNSVQVNFTPIGARLFFRMPLIELTNRIVELEDVLGPAAERALAQIADTPNWERRFDYIESLIDSRIADAREPSAVVTRAWSRLHATNGRINVATLANEAGWSRKHLAVQFREQFGVPPKTMARILRFQTAVRLLQTSAELHAAEVALRSGYYDQAHFNRDFREFAGTSPSRFVRERSRVA